MTEHDPGRSFRAHQERQVREAEEGAEQAAADWQSGDHLTYEFVQTSDGKMHAGPFVLVKHPRLPGHHVFVTAGQHGYSDSFTAIPYEAVISMKLIKVREQDLSG